MKLGEADGRYFKDVGNGPEEVGIQEYALQRSLLLLHFGIFFCVFLERGYILLIIY